MRIPRPFTLMAVLMWPLFLVACGNNQPADQSILNGRWELTESSLNEQSIEEAAEEFESALGSAVSEEAERAKEIAEEGIFYFDDGRLTVEDAEGGVTELTYKIISTNPEDNSLRIETDFDSEEVALSLAGSGQFLNEEGSAADFRLTLSDIRLESHSTEEPLEIEDQLDDLSERVSLQFFENTELYLRLDYVDDAAVPENR